MLTQEVIRTEYSTVAGKLDYSYGWELLADAATSTSGEQFAVYLSGQRLNPASDYAITPNASGVGGNVVLTYNPGSGKALVIESDNAYVQNSQYEVGGGFPSQSHERGLDRNTRLAQQLLQALTRSLRRDPALTDLGSDSMVLPDFLGNALRLLQLNATADGWTFADPAIVQVTPDPLSGLSFLKNSVPVNASDGLPELKASLVFPAGGVPLGAVGRILVPFGTSNGLTGMSIGAEPQYGNDIWSPFIPVGPANTVSNAGTWRRPQEYNSPSGRDVVIAAQGGPFDATGSILITAFYYTATPD